MPKNGKNPAQPNFTHNEKEIIDDITINLAISFDDFMRICKNPESLTRAYTKMASSAKNLDRIAMTLKLQNISPEQGMFPEEMDKEVARILSKDYEEDYHSVPSKLSRLSKLRNEFESAGILYSLEGMKNIKNRSPKSIPRKLKGGPARREGRPVVHKLTRSVEDYRKILSNPQAIDVISTRLAKHGILEKVFDLIV
jgi:hypothetical protein